MCLGVAGSYEIILSEIIICLTAGDSDRAHVDTDHPV